MENNKKKPIIHNEHLVTVLVSALTIPLSMSFWIINLIYSKLLRNNEGFDEPVVISPPRWLAACFIPIMIVLYGYKKKSLNLSGSCLALVVGFILTLSNFCFAATLFTFFLTASRATKVRPHLKRKIEADFKEGGQRSWVQVLCNSGMAAQLALLYLLDVGVGERPIDFEKDYRASWLAIGVLGVFSCCNADTWGSELGTVFGNSDPVLVTTWERVPKGTNGGISFYGTLFGCLGGMVVGLAHYVILFYFSDVTAWTYAPPQWPIILVGLIGGFFGSLMDSVLGALCQYSGMDKDGRIVNHSIHAVKHISGRNILDNHSVNLIASVITGLLLPTACKYLWPTF